jgi:hypothetical protein
MPENYDHYITKNIKALYKRRLFSPIVYLIIVIVLWHVFSLTDLLFPVQLTDDVPLESAYRNDAANMHTTLTDLKFTGEITFPGLPVIIITRFGMMNVSSYCFLLPPVKRDFLSLTR